MINYDLKKIYEWPFAAQIFLFCIFSVFIFYLGYIFDVATIRNNIFEAKKNEEQLKDDFKYAVEKKVKMQDALLQFPKLKELMVTWNNNIVSPKELQMTLDNLIKLGEDTHVKFNLFDPSTAIKDNFYYKIPVKIEMTGTFDQIASFISKAANYSKLIVIGNFTIAKEAQSNLADKSTATENFSASMTRADTPLMAQLTLEVYRT